MLPATSDSLTKGVPPSVGRVASVATNEGRSVAQIPSDGINLWGQACLKLLPIAIVACKVAVFAANVFCLYSYIVLGNCSLINFGLTMVLQGMKLLGEYALSSLQSKLYKQVESLATNAANNGDLSPLKDYLQSHSNLKWSPRFTDLGAAVRGNHKEVAQFFIDEHNKAYPIESEKELCLLGQTVEHFITCNNFEALNTLLSLNNGRLTQYWVDELVAKVAVAVGFCADCDKSRVDYLRLLLPQDGPRTISSARRYVLIITASKQAATSGDTSVLEFLLNLRDKTIGENIRQRVLEETTGMAHANAVLSLLERFKVTQEEPLFSECDRYWRY